VAKAARNGWRRNEIGQPGPSMAGVTEWRGSMPNERGGWKSGCGGESYGSVSYNWLKALAKWPAQWRLAA